MSQFPCAVERDLARHDAEMSERDRFEIALEAETERIYSEWMSCPRLLDPLLLSDAIQAADFSVDPDLTAAIEAFAKGDDETLGRLLRKIFGREIRNTAREEAELMLKERE